MPFQLVRNDITKMKVDAIVNAANNSLLGGGGVDGAIHRAAGPGLKAECRLLMGCDTGDAKLTGAYELPCRYVIHTVGPIWEGGRFGEEALLRSCYKRCLELAAKKHCESLAFPLISGGAYGYPKGAALQVATEEITGFLASYEDDMQVYLVLFDKAAADLGARIFSEVRSFIDDNYAAARTETDEVSYSRRAQQKLLQRRTARRKEEMLPTEKKTDGALLCEPLTESFSAPEAKAAQAFSVPAGAASAPKPNAAAYIVDESFSEMLLRKIDEKGMTDPQCYKKANIDKKLFSKIRSNPAYRPSKTTALAFALALELGLEETRELLMKAGYALSRSILADVIVEAYIRAGRYNIFEVNEALFANDQATLGSM